MKNKKLTIIICIILCITLIMIIINSNFFIKNELKKYADQNYGWFELINFNKNSLEKSITLKDGECGFIYTIKKVKNDFMIDGTTFFKYSTIESDFKYKYYDYIKIELGTDINNMEKKYDCDVKLYSIAPNQNSDSLIATINISESLDVFELAKELGSYIKKYDVKNWYDNTSIYIYNGDERIGVYNLSTNNYLEESDAITNLFLQSAVSIMQVYKNIEVKNVNDLTFVEKRVLQVDEIPGLEISNIAYDFDHDNYTSVDVYYYKYKNDTWIIADVLTSEFGGNLHVYRIK